MPSAISSTFVSSPASGSGMKLLEEIRLLAGDAVVQRLEAEPAREVRADLAAGEFSHVGVDQYRSACGLGHQLGMAGPLHGDEPPRRLLDRMADGEQAVVAQDCGLVVAEGVRDALALLEVKDDAGVLVEQRMVVVERA